MSKIIDFLQEKLISDQILADCDEANFFFCNFKPLNQEEKEIIQSAKKRLDNFSMAGLFLGASLAVSLRRYTPSDQGVSFAKLLFASALPISGFGFFALKGVNNSLNNLVEMRRKLIENDNDEYLQHLSRKFKKFPKLYHNDYDLVAEFMTQEEFNAIKQKSKKDFNALFYVQMIENLEKLY